jgi:hypothetical protein
MNGTEPPKKLKDLIDSIYSPNRRKIREHLQREAHLTAKQITKLLYGSLPLAEPTKKEYNRVISLLESMKKDKQVKCFTPYPRLPKHWTLSKRGMSTHGYAHETMCADVYVSCYLAGATDWIQEPKLQGIIPDRGCTLLGKEIYWEIDRGTEGLDRIESKVKKYVGLSGKFYVIFVAHETNRADNILSVLKKFQRRNQFLVTLHDYIQLSPFTDGYVSPLNPTLQYLEDIDSV